ncbi:hypothetical protein GCM10027037_21870 [Mucilaginibacter koreensis]
MDNQDLLALAVQLEEERCAAMVTGNVEDLKKYFSESLFYGHAGGFSDTFESFIERLTSGSVRYDAVTTQVHQVVDLGCSAFTLNGEVKVEAIIQSAPVFLHCAYVGVWKQDDAQWKFVAHQSVKLP